MRIALVGLNHDTAPLEVRERFVFNRGETEQTLVALTTGGAAAEAVLLSTCNRTELYTRLPGGDPGDPGDPSDAADVADAADAGAEPAATGPVAARPFHAAPMEAVLAARAGMDPAEASRYLYHHADADAVRHLFRVVSSLDSMIVGEAQIQGQVRDAYETAAGVRAARVVGPVLSRLFETALSVGGAVRHRTALGTGAASVPSAAVELAKKIFGPLKGSRALVLGAGEMSELAVQCLVAERVADVVVANRTEERAAALAARAGGRAVAYGEVPRLLPASDIIISATSAPHYVVTRPMMEAAHTRDRERPVLVVDLALPRDVEPSVADVGGVFLYGIDDLRQIVDDNRARRESEVPAAERIVAEAAADFWHWYRSLDVVPLVRAMRDRADRVRAAELDKALRRLGHLSDDDRAVVEALAAQLTNKLIHEPTVRLREGGGNGQPIVAEAARYLFDLDDDSTPGDRDTE